MWFWSQLPAPSQPAVVQALPSLSVQAVLVATGDVSQRPVRIPSVFAALQNEVRHSVPSGQFSTPIALPWLPLTTFCTSLALVCEVPHVPGFDAHGVLPYCARALIVFAMMSAA